MIEYIPEHRCPYCGYGITLDRIKLKKEGKEVKFKLPCPRCKEILTVETAYELVFYIY